jgi:hypothetical protein
MSVYMQCSSYKNLNEKQKTVMGRGLKKCARVKERKACCHIFTKFANLKFFFAGFPPSFPRQYAGCQRRLPQPAGGGGGGAGKGWGFPRGPLHYTAA